MPMPSSFRTHNFNRFKPTDLCIVKPIISSKTHLSQAVSSLDLLHPRGIRLPSHVLVNLLRRCSETKSYKEGKLVHLHLKLTGFKRPNTLIANHLIHMYFCCGDYVCARMLKQARSMFYQMPQKDYVSWNTMVVGYAHCGRFSEAFRQIHGQVLVVGFLSNVVVSSSIVDAYAKCGRMEDARRLFDDMPVRDIPAWTTTGLEREVTEFLIKWQPQSSAAYVLLSSTYAALVKWGLVEEVRHIMDERCVTKNQSISWIEIENEVHSFTLSDGLHPMKKIIYSALGHLNNQIEDNAPYLTEG
ncbi:hypothetical protein TSUD_62280 [Trifolium subterraneum]|uniref:Pentatricopeptide repeat-containing protein n=1 Tax=Trifolium subterraneum TaxID=3900 RepID=A0A2Z6MFN1_TRISU|nr:hypothetical protein TSUD_62280 [Trifolium subterraneum]